MKVALLCSPIKHPRSHWCGNSSNKPSYVLISDCWCNLHMFTYFFFLNIAIFPIVCFSVISSKSSRRYRDWYMKHLFFQPFSFSSPGVKIFDSIYLYLLSLDDNEKKKKKKETLFSFLIRSVAICSFVFFSLSHIYTLTHMHTYTLSCSSFKWFTHYLYTHSTTNIITSFFFLLFFVFCQSHTNPL